MRTEVAQDHIFRMRWDKLKRCTLSLRSGTRRSKLKLKQLNTLMKNGLEIVEVDSISVGKKWLNCKESIKWNIMIIEDI